MRDKVLNFGCEYVFSKDIHDALVKCYNAVEECNRINTLVRNDSGDYSNSDGSCVLSGEEVFKAFDSVKIEGIDSYEVEGIILSPDLEYEFDSSFCYQYPILVTGEKGLVFGYNSQSLSVSSGTFVTLETLCVKVGESDKWEYGKLSGSMAYLLQNIILGLEQEDDLGKRIMEERNKCIYGTNWRQFCGDSIFCFGDKSASYGIVRPVDGYVQTMWREKYMPDEKWGIVQYKNEPWVEKVVSYFRSKYPDILEVYLSRHSECKQFRVREKIMVMC